MMVSQRDVGDQAAEDAGEVGDQEPVVVLRSTPGPRTSPGMVKLGSASTGGDCLGLPPVSWASPC